MRVRGEWVELRPDELEAAMRLLGTTAGSAAAETIPALDVLRLASGLDAGPSGLPVEGVTADGWLEALLAAGDDGRDPRSPAAPRDGPGGLRRHASPLPAAGVSPGWSR